MMAAHNGYSIIQRRNGDVEVWRGEDGMPAHLVATHVAARRRWRWLPRWVPGNWIVDDLAAWSEGVEDMAARARVVR